MFSLLSKTNYEKYGRTSDVSYRYPELQSLYVERLKWALSPSYSFESRGAFREQLSRYFSGELPHSSGIFTLLLQAFMDGTTASDPHCELSDDCHTIPRVSRPWPNRTKDSFRMSLDSGIFEDFHLMIPSGSVPTNHPVHFARAVDEEFCSPFSCCEF